MKSFWAIIRLTVRNAVRSHIFQVLLLLLLLSVLTIPWMISNDGTAGGFIRVSLQYSLAVVSTILGLSSVWVGCFVMAQDIENYQLHMVVTKPVSRMNIWIAKWVGVCLIHLSLLFLVGLSLYGIIIYRYNQQEFTPEQREQIRNEVMVGRRVFWPKIPDYDTQTRDLVARRLKGLQERGLSVDTSAAALAKMSDDARREVVSAGSSIEFNSPRVWEFENLPSGDKPIYLRFRPYIGKVASEGQRMTRSWWLGGVARKVEAGQNTAAAVPEGGYELDFYAVTQMPQQVMSGEFHELTLHPEWKVVTPDRKVFLTYINADDARERQYFQMVDGPKLLIEVTGFFGNYSRAILVIAMELMILAGLGCAFGGFLTLPTAIFVVVSYLFFGSIAIYLAGMSYISGAYDQFVQQLCKGLLWILIPMQAFQTTGIVANGELVELSVIWELFWFYFICRALPLFALGIILYRRRELGLVIRK